MKTRLFLILGIFVFVFGITIIPFLIATNGSGDLGSLISFEDPDCNFGDQVTYINVQIEDVGFDVNRLKSGSVTFKEGCKTDISKLLGGTLDLSVENGATLSRQEFDIIDEFGEKSSTIDRFVLTSSGGLININGQELFLKEGDQLIIDKDGFVTQGKFEPIEGQSYDFAGFSIKPSTNGKVEFNLDKEDPFLLLPDDSIINNFDEKFTDLTIEGRNLKFSDEFAGALFGGASEDFRKFSGKLEFRKLSPNPDNPSTGSKERSARYVPIVPSGEEVHFLDAGITVKSLKEFGVPIVFGRDRTHFNIEGEFGTTLGDEDYILGGRGANLDFLSLGKDEIYVFNREEESSFGLVFDEGSNYAGFNLEENEFFSFEIEKGETLISEGKIEFLDSNPDYKIISGPTLWEGVGDLLTLFVNKGEKKESLITEFGFKTRRDRLVVEITDAGFSVNDLSVFKRGEEDRAELEIYHGEKQLTQKDLVWVKTEKGSIINWEQTFKRAVR